MKEYRPRIVDEMLKDKLEAKGAIVIEGPKWCGKTTTALQVAGSVLRMDEPSKRDANIQMSEIDPGRLLIGETPRLIDEWQIAPKLWDATRYEVDTRGEEGQFILTGSAVPVESEEITHSGTGRFTIFGSLLARYAHFPVITPSGTTASLREAFCPSKRTFSR